ncbi:DUF3109 family protein [Rhizosphaericola mali]|uniref:DUF3109 family protein n=1 Tax=Rhizosphaericola mali TaxID=2545455 RepID=A0A5P2G8Y6_9BACT|nr:DUF3109 family protein [Rhizosphaericola mali]QES90769.1 DUF3109 family protein [Rhizosphaericola mali]
MVLIEDKLIGDEILEAHFVCNIAKCKGGCCEDGDAGAPLEEAELVELENNYDVIAPYMSEIGRNEIELQGKYVHTEEFGEVTPTIDGGLCAYGIKDDNGVIFCAIEQAYNDGKLQWKKPISCHLFPIRVKLPDTDMEMLNYEPREEDHLCNPACQLGEELKVPVYKFLKEPIIRKYGTEFYEALDATAEYLNNKD